MRITIITPYAVGMFTSMHGAQVWLADVLGAVTEGGAACLSFSTLTSQASDWTPIDDGTMTWAYRLASEDATLTAYVKE